MKYIFEQKIPIIYFLLALFFELFALHFVDCKMFINRPLYPFLILAMFFLILLSIKSKRVQYALTIVFLIVQVLLHTGFMFLYDSNGTVFEWSMVNQRNDAFGTIEKLELRWWYLFPSLIIVGLYIVGVNIWMRKDRKKGMYKNNLQNVFRISTVLSIVLVFAILLTVPAVKVKDLTNDNYEKILYRDTSSEYQNKGIIGNALYEVVSGNIGGKIDTNTTGIEDVLYEKKAPHSDYFGVSSNNNLIMILVESMEMYPLTYAEEYASVLYPNITKFMDEGIYASNFYNREKTDTSEALSILGNYPTGKFVHYDFPKVETPFALPNMIKQDALDRNQDISINSYHHNYRHFYNRDIAHQTWGFEKFYGIEDMKAFGINDIWKHRDGERNLDSVMMEGMKEEMFKTDQRFFSYILSFTMHGYYGKRTTLKPYYDLLDEYDICLSDGTKDNEYLRTYMAAMMDFDKALGIMMDYLDHNYLLDDTTIVLFSDHNTYYNNLSYYAKKIDREKNPFDSDLYNIPLMIYDKKLVNKLNADGKGTTITKFTTTSDIVPTILDLFGISSWSNFYFGHSLFVDTESIVYSRAYGLFIDKGMVCFSLKNIMCRKDDYTDEDLADFEKRAKIHLNKLQYIDKIYYANYFAKNDYQK